MQKKIRLKNLNLLLLIKNVFLLFEEIIEPNIRRTWVRISATFLTVNPRVYETVETEGTSVRPYVMNVMTVVCRSVTRRLPYASVASILIQACLVFAALGFVHPQSPRNSFILDVPPAM
jgi:hypothetical protein